MNLEINEYNFVIYSKFFLDQFIFIINLQQIFFCLYNNNN